MASQKQRSASRNSNSGGVDFSVAISASAPLNDGGLVHAVTVIQPVQTWTVVRGQDDFRAVADSLLSSSDGGLTGLLHLPPCPTTTVLGHADNVNNGSIALPVDAVISARNELQQWLSVILMHPGARESPALCNFLTYAANMIPPQYENVPWTMFAANGQVLQTSPPPVPVDGGVPAVEPAYNASPNHQPSSSSSSSSSPAAVGSNHYDYYSNKNCMVDDMAMADMFDTGDDDHDAMDPVVHHDNDDADANEEYRASVRYKPTDEPITEEDEMEIVQMAEQVELIEDMGSLAQNVGRSMRLQEEEMATAASKQQPQRQVSQETQTGLQPGYSDKAVPRVGHGGIGSAMANAARGLGGAFNQTRLESPPRLDAFKMIKLIGKGSFGKVFLVREIRTGQMFALKVLKKDYIIKRNQVEHTNTERSVLGYVEHPFIVGMKMAFQSKEKLYFVLDYCAGGELFFHLCKLGKFPEPRSRFYAAEIILAISYVHTLGIIYRDLKPENILLDAMGHIRLTDFGLSKEGIRASSSGARSLCGTPEYLAPEIVNRQGHGRAVDWWSLGALLYEMLTGLPPFNFKDRTILFEKISNSELQYPAILSPNSKSLLRGLLIKDPTNRLGSGPNDAEDIKRAPFFASVDWEQLRRREIKPPWAPQIAGSSDTSQFGKEFTSMPVFSPHSMQCAPGFGTTPLGDNPFEGFTFRDRVLHGPGAATENQ